LTGGAIFILTCYNDDESQSTENQIVSAISLFDKLVYRVLAMAEPVEA
jgi:hypothetical protein